MESANSFLDHIYSQIPGGVGLIGWDDDWMEMVILMLDPIIKLSRVPMEINSHGRAYGGLSLQGGESKEGVILYVDSSMG